MAIDAVREMCIAARGAGRDPCEEYKLKNLVLAAADIDLMVATQRIAAEDLTSGVKRTTAYVSQHDKALGFSGWIFADRRLGRLDFEDLTEFERSVVSMAPRLTLVDVRAHTKGIGHGYFHSNPSVSSDVILVLRDDRDPGAANGRPLIELGPNYWEMDDGYPQSAGKER